MENVDLIKVEDGYVLSVAATLNQKELIPSERETTVFKIDLLNLWGDLMFVWHENTIGSTRIDLSGQNKEDNKILVPDNIWRQMLTLLNPVACATIDAAQK
jgi:hypothetical protein